MARTRSQSDRPPSPSPPPPTQGRRRRLTSFKGSRWRQLAQLPARLFGQGDRSSDPARPPSPRRPSDPSASSGSSGRPRRERRPSPNLLGARQGAVVTPRAEISRLFAGDPQPDHSSRLAAGPRQASGAPVLPASSGVITPFAGLAAWSQPPGFVAGPPASPFSPGFAPAASAASYFPEAPAHPANPFSPPPSPWSPGFGPAPPELLVRRPALPAGHIADPRQNRPLPPLPAASSTASAAEPFRRHRRTAARAEPSSPTSPASAAPREWSPVPSEEAEPAPDVADRNSSIRTPSEIEYHRSVALALLTGQLEERPATRPSSPRASSPAAERPASSPSSAAGSDSRSGSPFRLRDSFLLPPPPPPRRRRPRPGPDEADSESDYNGSISTNSTDSASASDAPQPRRPVGNFRGSDLIDLGDWPPERAPSDEASIGARSVVSAVAPLELDPERDKAEMASSQFLNPRDAALPIKQRASQAAREWQAIVADKVRRTGAAEPPFEFLELIGKGAFGRVFKSKHLPTNKVVAVKIVDVDASDAQTMESDDSIFQKSLTETKIMKTLKEMNAKNINIIFDAFEFDHDVWIISEYCPGGSLRTLMKARKTPGMAEKYIIPIARELAEALKWVHSVGVIHRDLKPSNVLIGEDGRLQLCDFGVSQMMELNSEMKFDKRATFTGTTNYMPIEMLVAESHNTTSHQPVAAPKYGFEMDIWAYGCVLYELAMGYPPNANLGQSPTILAPALQEKLPRIEDLSYSEALRDLVAMCLQGRPQDRPSIEVVQQHRLIYLSEAQYPTSSLRDLLEEYHLWEMSGGQRVSLVMEGGAAVSDHSLASEEEFWNYSTTENFDRTVAARRASELPARANLSLTSSNDEHAEDHPRIPLFRNALERLFDKDDDYNYLERGQSKYAPMDSSSDLPLRNQNQNSSIRDTMIDLGDFDTETGTAKIPSLLTLRGNKPSNIHFHDSDDEADMTYRQGAPKKAPAEDVDREKRGTMQWKFPEAVLEPAPAARPSTITEEDDDTRRQTMNMDWKFPSSVEPSTQESTGRSSYVDDYSSVPTLSSQNTATGEIGYGHLHEPATARLRAPSGAHNDPAQQTLQETMSAPVSPPDTMIDLGEYQPRPSTADSVPGPFSPELDPDDPFGVETTGTEAGQSNRFSYHKQTRSDPTALERPSGPGADRDAPAADRGGRRRSRRPAATGDGAEPLMDDEDSDVDDEASSVLTDPNAKQHWKDKFYKEWVDADLFDPIPKNLRYPGEGRAHDGEGSRSGHSRRHRPRGSSARSGDANASGSSRLNMGGHGAARRETESLSRNRSITRTQEAAAGTGEATSSAKAVAHDEDDDDEWDDSDSDSIFDFRGLERYVAQAAPAPPSVAALTEGADPEVLAREFERVVGAWNESLDVIQRVMGGEDRRH